MKEKRVDCEACQITVQPAIVFGLNVAQETNGRARLTVTGMSKRYRGRNVVEGVGLVVDSGEVVGLLGPNGAGKTTFFYMILGLIKADAGSIRINDQDLSRAPMHRRARAGIGYLPQEASVFRKLSVEQNILAVAELRRDLGRTAQRETGRQPLERPTTSEYPRQRRRATFRRRAAAGRNRPGIGG